MKRLQLWALIGVLALAMAGVAAAQSTPEPVVRMGDWIEIGDDAWMNIIGANTMRYRWTDNLDFDSDVQDKPGTTNLSSGSCLESECDIFQIETRFGADFRYKKDLTMRVLFEQQHVYDGRSIDGNEGLDPHVERAWIDYKVPNTGLRIRVGAHLWIQDPLGWVGDDDPGFDIYYEAGPLELHAAAMIEQDGTRLGLANDNDLIYYLFDVAYNLKPHRFSLNIYAARDRYCPDCPDEANSRMKTDVVNITPAWEGKFSIFKFVLQGSVAVGEASRGPAPGDKLDIFAYAFQAVGELDLGKIKPFFSILYGSGDDDPNDDELNAYASQVSKEITLGGSSIMSVLRTNSSMYSGVEQDPMYSGIFGVNSANSRLRSGDNWFNNNWGAHQSYDIRGGYAGPGSFHPAFGVRFFPVKGWEIAAHWAGRFIIETDTIEAQLGGPADIDKFLYQEIGALVIWKLSKHFDVLAKGRMMIPGEGAKDLAEQADPANCGRTAPDTCDGDDIALVGQVKIRARF